MTFPIDRFHNRSQIALLIALAMVARVCLAITFPDSMLNSPAMDPDDYSRFAHTVAVEGTFGPNAGQPSAFRPPAYPLLLSPWSTSQPPRVWGIFLLHLLLSAGIVGFTWILAQQAGAAGWAWAATFLVAVDPLLVHQASLIMSETLFTFLFCALLTLWLRGIPPIEREEPKKARTSPFRGGGLRLAAMRMVSRQRIDVSDLDRDSLEYYQRPPTSRVRLLLRSTAVGAVLGFAILTRPIALPFWALLLIPSIVQKRASQWGVATIVALACCSPWVVRNYERFKTPILTTTHGGYTLWLGQNPVFYEDVVSKDLHIWPSKSHEQWNQMNAESTSGMTEVQRDRHFRNQALSWMAEHPTAALRTIVHHLRSMWSPLPHVGPVKLRRACLVFYVAVFTLALVGLQYPRIWTTDLIALPIALLSFTLVHAFYWSNIRMRAPLEPILAVLVAVALQRFVPRRPRDSHAKKRPWH